MTMNAPTRAGIAALAALSLALGVSAPAGAERIWDIEAYDNCMAQIPTFPTNFDYDHWKCCTDSDGDYEHVDGPGDMGNCKAPPAEAESVPGTTGPTVTGKPRPPLDPGTSVGVSDDPMAATPLPTPTPKPRPDAPAAGSVG